MRLRGLAPLVFLLTCALSFGQPRPHVYDMRDVNWSVVLDPDHEALIGDVVNTIQADEPLAEATIDCGADLQLDRVTVDGQVAKFRRKADKLSISLPKAAIKGQILKLRVMYHGSPQAGLYFVPASRAFPADKPLAYTQGEMEDNRQWLPTYDYPDNKATSEGRIETPKGWVAISNGQLLDVQQKPTSTVYHWKMNVPHATYLISLTAGPYVEQMENWDGIPVSYWAPAGLEDQAKATFAGTNDIVGFYSGLTGVRYPYVKFTQDVVADFMFGGMENITAVTQTIDALHPASAAPVEDATELIAHELAHQWFGDLVTCKDWSHTWLNEGFATFLPAFWDRQAKGVDAYDLDRYGAFKTALDSQRNAGRSVVWTGYKNPLDMFDGMAYQGGASRMYMLMDLLGEDRFWKSITTYLNDWKYRSLGTEDFFADMSKSSGVDLTPFMKQWFYTPAVPQLTISAQGSQIVIEQKAPFFTLDLPVWIRSANLWKTQTVHLTGAKETLDIGTSTPDSVLVDPEFKVMAILDDQIVRTPEQKANLYLLAPNTAERSRLFDDWSGSLTQAVRLQLEQKEPSLQLRTRWIGALDASNMPALIAATKDADARIRNAAARQLGNVPVTDDSRQALRSLADGDANDTVRQSAYRSLLWITNDVAMADTAFHKDGFQDRYRRIAMEWWTAHAADAARTHALDVLAGGYSEPLRVDCINDLGQLRDRPEERSVYRALLKIAQEHSFGARSAAIRALGRYGDKKAMSVIAPLQNHPLVFIRDAANEAAQALGG